MKIKIGTYECNGRVTKAWTKLLKSEIGTIEMKCKKSIYVSFIFCWCFNFRLLKISFTFLLLSYPIYTLIFIFIRVQQHHRCLKDYNLSYHQSHIDDPAPFIKNCSKCQQQQKVAMFSSRNKAFDRVAYPRISILWSRYAFRKAIG